MKKNLLSNLMLFWLLCLSIAPALAQQNEKIVFPTPVEFQTSIGSFLTQTSDGGFLLLGNVDTTDWNTIGINTRPRVIKLDANLDVVWDNLYVPPTPGRGGLTFPKGDAFELPDGDFLLGLHNDSSSTHLLRLNADGSVHAEIALPAQYERSAQVLDILDNGNYLVFVDANQNTLKHLDPNGTEVFSINVNHNAPILLSNGDLLYFKYSSATAKTTFIRTDNLGALIWQSQGTPGIFNGLVALPNGGFGAYSKSNSIWKIRFFDDAGIETGLSPDLPISGQISGIKSFPDGSLLASGTTVTNRGFMARFNADGTLVWAAEAPEDNQSPLTSMFGIPTTDGWAAGVGGTLSNQMGFLRVTANSGIIINTLSGTVRHDADENCIADQDEPTIQHPRVTASNAQESFTTHANAQGEYTLLLPAGDFTITTDPNHPFFFQCPTAANTVSFPQGGNGSATVDIPVQSLDIIHEIKGKVILDENNDCIADPDEPVAKFWKLRIAFGSNSINLATNNIGEYQVFLPSGDYSIQAFPLNSNYGICAQNTRLFSFASATPVSQTEDFVVFPEMDCTQLSVSLDNDQVRPCTTSSFSVNYRNSGTIPATDVAVDVVLDPMLEFVDAYPFPSSVTGNTLHFDIGTLEAAHDGGYGKAITVWALPSCSLGIGQQVCVSAHITPETPCQDLQSWQGAFITVEGECRNDSAVFKIRNIGNAGNAGLLDYIIDEDQIVLRQDLFQLPVLGEQIEAVLPLQDTSTVTITADQEPGAPGPTQVTFSLTNCKSDGGGDPSGMGGDSGPFSDNKCFAVVNSFDPNDKTASPLGFGDDHLVRHGTPLDYKIRFQNTGNDTAFLVILRDTISDKMNRGTIEIMGASHTFDFAQINDSILHIRFDNILLPDSLTNPEGSQGFISFRIYPKADLPNGTVVNNRAAIYFDQNPPIITNTVWRTYGEYFVVSTDEEINPQRVRVNVSPNPFVSETNFELLGDSSDGAYQLDVFDAAGKLLRTMSFSEKTCQLRREDIANGIHFWRISEKGKVLASGKIVAGN